MFVGQKGDFEFGANTICARYQYRIVIARRLKVKQRAKSTKATGNTRTRGCLCQWFDTIDKGIPGINIDTGVLIGKAIGGGHFRDPWQQTCMINGRENPAFFISTS